MQWISHFLSLDNQLNSYLNPKKKGNFVIGFGWISFIAMVRIMSVACRVAGTVGRLGLSIEWNYGHNLH